MAPSADDENVLYRKFVRCYIIKSLIKFCKDLKIFILYVLYWLNLIKNNFFLQDAFRAGQQFAKMFPHSLEHVNDMHQHPINSEKKKLMVYK